MFVVVVLVVLVAVVAAMKRNSVCVCVFVCTAKMIPERILNHVGMLHMRAMSIDESVYVCVCVCLVTFMFTLLWALSLDRTVYLA